MPRIFRGARHSIGIRHKKTWASFFQHEAPVDCSLVSAHNNKPGLLKGATGKFYTWTLFKDGEVEDLKENLKSYTKRGGFWEVAERCAVRNGFDGTTAYVEEIYGKAKEFIESEELEDRDELKSRIDAACNVKGISMLLGGKSTGKSFLVESINNDLNTNGSSVVLKADLRLNVDLFRAMEKEFAQELVAAFYKKDWSTILKDFTQTAADAGNRFASSLVAGDPTPTKIEATTILGAVAEAVLRRKETSAFDLLDSFVTEAENREKTPVLMIDEANLLVRNPKENSEIMAHMVALTKQQRKLSVLLISSDPALPFLLKDTFGFELHDLRRTIVAGELPPDRMISLLVEKWGMDPELAHYSVGVYGGHIYDAYAAIELLRDAKDDMSAFDVEPKDALMNIIRCLEAEDGNDASFRAIQNTVSSEITKIDDLAGLNDTLRELAASGFVPLQTADDDFARILSKYNIAAVVDKDSFVFGLDAARWTTTTYKFALVPASQFMRMIIARELNDSGRLEKRPSFW